MSFDMAMLSKSLRALSRSAGAGPRSELGRGFLKKVGQLAYLSFEADVCRYHGVMLSCCACDVVELADAGLDLLDDLGLGQMQGHED